MCCSDHPRAGLARPRRFSDAFDRCSSALQADRSCGCADSPTARCYSEIGLRYDQGQPRERMLAEAAGPCLHDAGLARLLDCACLRFGDLAQKHDTSSFTFCGHFVPGLGSGRVLWWQTRKMARGIRSASGNIRPDRADVVCALLPPTRRLDVAETSPTNRTLPKRRHLAWRA